MTKSIYIKLVLIFICVFLFGNIVAYSLTALMTEYNLKEELQNQISETLMDVRNVDEQGAASEAAIVKLFENGYISVQYFETTEEIHLAYAVEADDLVKLSDGEVVFTTRNLKRHHAEMPVGIIVSRAHYFVATPVANSIVMDFRSLIFRVAWVSLLIGTLIMLLVARRIIKPVKALSSATEKIAKGDFDVVIKAHGKDEVGKLIHNFNAMVKELKSIEILRNDFVSDISHEFKTPLTSVEGYTKLLKDCHSDEEREGYIQIILEETQRLSSLSSNILMLNRLENENVPIKTEPFRLDEQIRKVVLLCENKWSAKQLELIIELEEVTYNGNEQMLYQVWLNIFDNAIKFSPEGGKIEVSLQKQQAGVVVVVRDYGKGIPLVEQNRIFTKFYKGDKARSGEGNGLGLSIVKRIIDRHQGEIEVVSNVGLGTEVKIFMGLSH